MREERYQYIGTKFEKKQKNKRYKIKTSKEYFISNNEK